MNLTEMSAKELCELKTKWYKEAQDKITALYSIARNLGERVSHNYGPKYLFKMEGLHVYVDDYGSYMTVHLDGNLIVSTHNERLYIPGEWEAAIPSLKAEADLIETNRRQAKEQKEKDALLQELSIPKPSNLHPLFEQILKPFMP